MWCMFPFQFVYNKYKKSMKITSDDLSGLEQTTLINIKYTE